MVPEYCMEVKEQIDEEEEEEILMAERIKDTRGETFHFECLMETCILSSREM